MVIPDNWKHDKPKLFYPKAVKLFGNPLYTVNQPHGLAMWRGNNLFSHHLLMDEEVAHCQPAKHTDFFYSFVKFYVPPRHRESVLSISGSIIYDGLKKELRARCASLEANIATLFLAMNVAMDLMSIEDVKKKGLYGAYIRGEMEDHGLLYHKMVSMKNANEKKYSRELKLQYDPLAFDRC
jgi:hypothetical protein